MEEILNEISKKYFDREVFLLKALKDEKLCDFLVQNMINHPKIMIYYHCFYVISDACSKNPRYLYHYIDEFIPLLKHSNSYHRDFGLILLAKLARVDVKKKIDKKIYDYFELLHDDKFSTAEVCVNNCFIIAHAKIGVRGKIINHLLEYENTISYPEKQKALMMGCLIKGFNLIFNEFYKPNLLLEFAQRHLNSISPKTQKTAKDFLKNYDK